MHARYQDAWIVEALDAAERALAAGRTDALAQALAPLPLELFTLLYFDRPARWPKLSAWLPALPSEADQRKWTGAAGWQTMHAAAVFVGDALAKFGRDPLGARVLDYGCGWGRMLRMLYARFDVRDIYAVDPWPPSLERLRERGVHGNIAEVDYKPERLPFEERFDLIYAYSVFTHIGAESRAAALKAMRGAIAEDGLLALTVRPAAYWESPTAWPDAETKAALLDRHLTHGLAFVQIPPGENGHDDYGHCSISPDYIAREWSDWRLDGVQWRAAEQHQTTVFLRPA